MTKKLNGSSPSKFWCLAVTPEEVKTIQRLYRQGVSTKELAKQYDCRPCSIRKYLNIFDQ